MSVRALLPEERAAAIRGRLDRDGRVVAAEPALTVGAGEDTIRRDLAAVSRSIALVSTDEKLGTAARFQVLAGAEIDVDGRRAA